jgi:hypothetical protein
MIRFFNTSFRIFSSLNKSGNCSAPVDRWGSDVEVTNTFLSIARRMAVAHVRRAEIRDRYGD